MTSKRKVVKNESFNFEEENENKKIKIVGSQEKDKDSEEKIINNFFSRYMNLENEIKTLQNDKKELFDEFKNKVSKKSFTIALSFLKKKASLKDHELNELNRYEKILEEKFCVEHVD